MNELVSVLKVVLPHTYDVLGGDSMHEFLVHKHGDHVGVATVEIEVGQQVVGVCMAYNATVACTGNESIQLGK